MIMMMQLNKYQHSQKLQQQQQHQQRRPYNNVVIRQQYTIMSLTTIRRWKSKSINKTYSCNIRFIINSIMVMMMVILILIIMMICLYYCQHNWNNLSIYNQDISRMNIISFQYHYYYSQPKDQQQQQQQQQQNHHHQQRKLNQILFTGSFGLGHRMNKLSSIYHLLASPYLDLDLEYNHKVNNDSINHRIEFYKYIQIINVSWGTCPQPPPQQSTAQNYTNKSNIINNSSINVNNNNIDIFEYLFQSTILSIPEILQYNNYNHNSNIIKTFNDHNNNNNNYYYGNKVLWIRNDVTGYYAGQSYKNSKLPINRIQQQQSQQQQYVNNNNPNDNNSNNNNNNNQNQNSIIDLYNSKFITDYQLYNYLYNKKFIGINEIQKFIKYHQFDQYYSIGIHLRFGNGEIDHFISSKRNQINYINDQQLILQHLIHSIIQLYETTVQQEQQDDTTTTIIKPLLVFVATDTASYIEPLRIGLLYYNISMIVYDNQIRIPDGYGVSYNPKLYEMNNNNTKNNTNIIASCYQNWYSSVMDMILLSKCNVVIASSRSTFTQIVPLNLLFLHTNNNQNHHNQNHNDQNQNSKTNSWKYCEMDLLSSITTSNISSSTSTTTNNYAQSIDTITTTIAHTKMTCFKNHTSWLLRDNHLDWITFCTTTKTIKNTSYTTTNNTFNNYHYNDPISSYDCNDMNRNSIFMDNNHENNNNNQQVKSFKNQSIIPIEPVTHKLMLHLPDITSINTIHENKMYTDTIQYLQSPLLLSNDNTTTSTTTTLNDYYYYGKKYNTKYRIIYSRKKQQNKKLQQQQLLEVFQANWTWE